MTAPHASPSLRIAGETVRPGEKRAIRIPVTVDLNGHEIALWVHVVAGERPGPTLGVTAAQHGDEWQTSLVVREIVLGLDPGEMRGNLIALPVCSQPALGMLSRLTQLDSDGPDLNRVFPGVHTWIPEQIAAAIDREVFPHVNALIDFHFGIWGTGIGIVAYGVDSPDPAVVERSRAMALAYGYPVVQKLRMYSRFPGPRSLLGYAAAERGIPGMASEVGVAGVGKAIEDRYTAYNLRGVRNVMKLLGILEGAPERPARTLVFERGVRLSAAVGGLLLPQRDPDEAGRHVELGERLGRVVSPYTFETLQEIVATATGPLTLAPRSYAVRPGDWAFGIADETAPGSEWVTHDA